MRYLHGRGENKNSMEKQIYIWGTGNTGKSVVQNGINGEIAGWVETSPSKSKMDGKKVISYKELTGDEIVVVATIYADEVYDCLQREQVDIKNYIFYCRCKSVDCRTNLELAKKILSEKNIAYYLTNYKAYEYSFFAQDLAKYRELNVRGSFAVRDENIWPFITDKYGDMGTVDDSFWESVWVASRIRENMPEVHHDIGSRLNGFLSIIIAMGIPLKAIDVRPFPKQIEGMETIVDDATELRQFEDDSIESLSAVSSLEHFGLGRYGDKIDPEACFKCFANIQKKMMRGGRLYITVPIGKERVCFNACRVFEPKTIINEFSHMDLIEFAYISKDGLHRNVDLEQFGECNDGLPYYDGLFFFKKKE